MLQSSPGLPPTDFLAEDLITVPHHFVSLSGALDGQDGWLQASFGSDLVQNKHSLIRLEGVRPAMPAS